jgi:hypothetical protein
MNQREKLQAQLEILQELKEQFRKNAVIPSGEDFASMDTRYENGEIAISMTFNQMQFENKLDSNLDMFFDDFIYETETKLEDIVQEESDAYNNHLTPHFGNPLGDVDELMNSIKAKLVESIKK